MPDQETFDAFLSHSHGDADIVKQLAERLEDQEGLHIWLDQWILVPGEDWIPALARGLDQAKCCVVCIGEQAPRRWCQQEIERALKRQVQDPSFRVIPLLLPGAVEENVKDFLELRTWVDMRKGLDDADAFHRLVCGIKGIPPGRGPDVQDELEQLRESGEFPDPGPLPPGSRLPFTRNALFTGRVEPLSQMAQVLLGDRAQATLITQAIQGMGGVGKTQLAVEFAYRYGRYFQGVHWLNAARPESLEAEVALCGAEMRLPNWPDEQPEQVRVTLQEWKRSGPRLVILDNLEDPQAAREWLGRLSGGAIRVLVTARRSGWPQDLGLAPLELQVFSPPESLTFLRRYLPAERASDYDLKLLAERLGHLPLAEELAGRYLERLGRMSVAQYLEQLEHVLDHRSMQAWREELGNPTDHDLDLARTFALSWQQVTDPAARKVLAVAGYCAPNEPIPCALLEQAAGIERGACDEALDVLTGLALLEGSGEPKMHLLVGQYMRALCAQASEGQELAQGAVLSGLGEASVSLTYVANESGSPERFQPLRPHVERLLTGYGVQMERAATLWNNLGHYELTIADYAGARDAFERALAIDEAALGPHHPTVAAVVNNLGSVLRDLGDLAGACDAFARALAIDEAVLGPHHPTVAAVVNNLGSVLQDLGDLQDARAAYERALAIDEAAFGMDHPNAAPDINNLGSVLYVLGDLLGARDAFRRALAITEAAFGSDHPRVATCVNNLGGVQRDLGDLQGARNAFRRALSIDEAAFGPEHPTVARDISNLGEVLRALGDLQGARAACERALAIDEAAFGPGHPAVATVVNNLGGVLYALGDLQGARAGCDRALAIDETAFGPDHPAVATVVNNLGTVLQALGDLQGARDAFQRALAIREQSLPPGHSAIERVRRNLEVLDKQEHSDA